MVPRPRAPVEVEATPGWSAEAAPRRARRARRPKASEGPPPVDDAVELAPWRREPTADVALKRALTVCPGLTSAPDDELAPARPGEIRSSSSS